MKIINLLPEGQNGELTSEADVYKQMLEVAQVGWWEADFGKMIFHLSDYLVSLLELDIDSISFKDAGLKVRADYRTRIISEFLRIDSKNHYEQIFPLQTRYSEKWVCCKLCTVVKDKEGWLYVRGVIQLLTNQHANDNTEQLQDRVNEILNNIGNLSRILQSFNYSKKLETSVDKTLQYLLNSFDGLVGHVFLMSIDYENRIFCCDHEAYSPNRQSNIHSWKNVPVDKYPWFIEKLTNGIPVTLNSIDDLPSCADSERRMIQEKQIYSLKLLPLINKGIVTEVIGLSTYCSYRLWSAEDHLWLSATANLINAFIDMAKTLDALEKKEMLLHDLYDSIPVGIEFYNKEGVLLGMNNKNIEIFGILSREQFAKINLFENPMIPAAVRGMITDNKPFAFRQDYYFDRASRLFETDRCGSADISTKVIMLFGRGGEVENYVLINIDNTEQVIVYNRLEEFEYFFSLISKFAGVGYACYDLYTLEGNALDQWYRNMGECPGTPLNQIIGIYKSIHQEDKKSFVEFINKVKHGDADHVRGDVRVHTNQGWKWIRINIMKSQHDAGSGKINIICLNYDITEIKLSEEKKNKAEELERVKSAFLANITHDIKTPLNAIVGFSTLLGETDDPEERKSYVDIIHMNNDLLLQLISNVLDLAKIESGMIQFHYTDVDLKEVLHSLAVSLQIKAQGTVKLVVENCLPDCTIRTDRLRLIQVISNLMNNAIKYTSEGTITIAYKLKQDEVIFTVTDTGEGISEENQAHIFDRFYKGYNNKQGTGLGLSICQGIIKQFGGQMGVTSDLGKGSCFWFTHPR